MKRARPLNIKWASERADVKPFEYGTGNSEPVGLNQENAGYRIFEAADSNPFRSKSGSAPEAKNLISVLK
jgi:hypothetical protein